MRLRWYVWAAALVPAAAGVLSLATSPDGDFRSSGMMAGVATTLGAIAVLLLFRRKWRTATGLRKLMRIAGIGFVGLVALGGLAGGLPEFLQARFGLFTNHDDYGPRALEVVGGGFVAIGDEQNGGVIWYSDDGFAWSRASAGFPLDGWKMRDLVVTDMEVLAVIDPVDDRGMVIASADGRSWHIVGGFGSESEFGFRPDVIDVLDDRLVIVGSIYGNDVVFFQGGDVATLSVADPAPEFDDGEDVVDVACNQDGCVAVGRQSDVGVFSTSDLGAAVWTTVDATEWNLTPTAFGSAELKAVAPAMGGFVVVGNDAGGDRGVVWTSVEGREWVRITDLSVFEDAVIDGVATIDAGLIAFGRDVSDDAIVIWVSPDGMRWERSTVDRTTSAGSAIRSVARNGTVFVAMGIDTSIRSVAVWTSQDGHTWHRVPHDEVAFGSS